jgi:hypothetical protein
LLTLADYIDLKKVVAPDLYPSLNAIGIYTFAEFGQYIGKKLGQARFRSWTAMSTFLSSLETPTLTNLPTGANTNILYNNTITTLTNQFGTGSGPLGNPVMIDYLGACAGDPYTNRFYAINSNYDALAVNIVAPLSNLDRAIVDYSNAYNAYLASEIPDSAVPPDPPVGDGVPPDPLLLLPFSIVTSNVSAVNSALSSLPNVDSVAVCNSSWYLMLSRIPIEVANLNRAGVAFTAGTTLGLLSFAETIGQTASDKTQAEGYQFFANVTTNDAAGDSIRAVVAETLNTRALNGVGVNIYNNPDPRLKISQSQAQNVPLTTYLSQNK